MRFIIHFLQREFAKRWVSYLLFSTCTVLGITSFVVVNSLRESLLNTLQSDSKELLGGDLMLSSFFSISDETYDFLQDDVEDQISMRYFTSMVQMPNEKGTKLVAMKSFRGDFPFYGDIVTEGNTSLKDISSVKEVLVSFSLRDQFELNQGDSLKIGKTNFLVRDFIVEEPGGNAFSTLIAPSVYMSLEFLPQTGLAQYGSRIQYVELFKLKPKAQIKAKLKANLSKLDQANVRVTNVEERQKSIGNVYTNFTTFLSIVGFVSMLIGVVGVFLTVQYFVKKSKDDLGVLLCIGASRLKVNNVFLGKVFLLAVIGTALGTFFGWLILAQLPVLLASYLPNGFEIVLSNTALSLGILIGLLTPVIVAIPAFFEINALQPYEVIRKIQFSMTRKMNIIFSIVLAVFLLSILLFVVDNPWLAVYFFVGLSILLVLIYLLSTIVKQVLFVLAARVEFYPLRYALNTFNAKGTLSNVLVRMLVIGTSLVVSVVFIQDFLLEELEVTEGTERPNLLFFDVRTAQLEEIDTKLENEGVKIVEEVPIVAMRLESVNGVSRLDLRKDTINPIEERYLDLEYRATFREHLHENESILKGEWVGESTEPQISIEQRMADNLHVDVGDEIVFDIQGVSMKARIASVRKIVFNSFRTNFTILFPRGVIDKAPKMMAISTIVSQEDKAKVQREVVRDFPNISVLDFDLVAQTVLKILSKLTTSIQFMAFFSVLTSLFVLVSSIYIGKFDKLKDIALIRTIGASNQKMIGMVFLEYLILGFISTFLGVFLSYILTGVSAYFLFETIYIINAWKAVTIIICGAVIVAGLGLLFNSNLFGKTSKSLLEVD